DALADLGPARHGVAQQQVVELRPLDLVRLRVVLVARVGEDDGPRRPVGLVPEECAELLLEPRGADLLGHAEPFEDRQREGEQGLADVKTGEALALQDEDPAPGARKGRRDARPSGAAANDDGVVGWFHEAIVSSGVAADARLLTTACSSTK